MIMCPHAHHDHAAPRHACRHPSPPLHCCTANVHHASVLLHNHTSPCGCVSAIYRRASCLAAISVCASRPHRAAVLLRHDLPPCMCLRVRPLMHAMPSMDIRAVCMLRLVPASVRHAASDLASRGVISVWAVSIKRRIYSLVGVRPRRRLRAWPETGISLRRGSPAVVIDAWASLLPRRGRSMRICAAAPQSMLCICTAAP